MTGAPNSSRGATWGGRRQGVAFAVIVLVAVVLIALNAGRQKEAPQAPPVPTTASTSPAAAGPAFAYLALGDSLSRGVQPDDALTLKHGYPRDLEASLKTEIKPKPKLIEAGCGGATTQSMIVGGKPCAPDAPIPYSNQTPATSQLAWAVEQLKARRSKPTLVTLTIGGNDLTSCLNTDEAKLKDCLHQLMPQLERRWATIARELRAAAGRRTVLSVATTYDPILAYIRLHGGRDADAARAFHAVIVKQANPALKRIFSKKGWQIADVGFAMHENGPIKDGHARAVNAVCALTWACSRADVHLNNEGYQVAASVFEGAVLDPLTKLLGSPLASG